MSKIIFLFLFVISCGYFLLEIVQRIRAVKLGKPENRSDRARERWTYFMTQVLWHKKIRKYPFFGLLHGFMMWGFVVLLFSSFDMVLTGLFKVQTPWVLSNTGYVFLRNGFLFLAMIGVIGSFLRRIVKKPEWMHNSFMSFVILALIFVIVASESIYYALQTAMVSPNMMQFFWWTHFLAMFAFFFIIPHSKHLHLAFAPFNTYWHSLEPKGALKPVALMGEKEEIYGVAKPEEFTWKQMLDALSCVKCGRCHGSCPVFQSGGKLRLKKLNGRLRTHLEKKARFLSGRGDRKSASVKKLSRSSEKKRQRRRELVAGVFEAESLWSCTTCGACEEACPVSCEHGTKIIDLRRYLVSSKQNIPAEMKELFSGIENWGNPWGSKRQSLTYNWAEELGIPTIAENPKAEYLYFVGCTPSFNASAQKTALAFAKILRRAGIDVAILGEEEYCCGESARRLGNEALFQETARKNIFSWNSYGIKKMITTCPHCFNTLYNEYSQFGGEYEVIPHVAFLNDLLRTGKIKQEKAQEQIITHHDSCYLGRYNGFYHEPREILRTIPGVNLVEMSRSREDSFCCGAGGGQFWLKSESKHEITKHRVEEALATGADMVSTACSYCRIALEEEIERKGLNMRTVDIAEILESSL